MKPIDEYGRLAATASKLVAEILKREGAQAQALFDRITKRHGLPTAKILFERCIKLAKEPTFEEEQKRDAEKHANKRKAQAARALSKLPTLEQIAAANRNRICNWWYQWPDRKLKKQEREIYNALLRRYIEVKGYPEDFDPRKIRRQRSAARCRTRPRLNCRDCTKRKRPSGVAIFQRHPSPESIRTALGQLRTMFARSWPTTKKDGKLRLRGTNRA
jgi:hypothetical protein